MKRVLKIGDKTITGDDLILLLDRYQMLPKLLREMAIDRAIQDISCTPEEQLAAQQQFYQQEGIETERDRQAWLNTRQLTQEQLETAIFRHLKIEKFKQKMWGDKIESDFLKYKPQLDKVIYSLLRTKDRDAAYEFYCRLLEEEASFADLARNHSQGSEAKTGGRIGPIAANQAHPTLARILAVSQPGRLWPPTRLNDWFIIVRLEQIIPAQLDESMRQKLLSDRFETWLQEQIAEMNLQILTLDEAVVAGI